MQSLEIAQSIRENVIATVVQVLTAGGLVLFPTETTYAAGVDATNPTAVKKLLDYKSRREGKPLSIVVTDKRMASKYLELNPQAEQLFDRFLPGPVTIVCTGKHSVAPGVESEFGTLGIRVPDYPLIVDIVTEFGRPITATSANASGKKRPYTIADIMQNLSAKQKNLVDLVLDAGELPHNEPSTVVDTTTSTPLTLRESGRDFELANYNFELASRSETETKAIAGKLLLKNWNQIKKRPFIIALDGPLGAGKTVFAKGVAEFLQISDEVNSPTYTYLEEYDFQRHGVQGKFFHLDLWKVDSQELFDRLEIPSLLTSQFPSILVIEWWNQVAGFAKKRGINADLLVEFEEIAEGRSITIVEN